MYYHAEFEINTICDLKCFGCDRFLDIGPDKDMTVHQIQYFLKESVELGWPWERFHILGGEPTLHPQLEEICAILADYKAKYRPSMMLRVLSNGYGKLDETRKIFKKYGILVHTEGKQKGVTPPYFRNIRLAPIDEAAYANREHYEICGIHGERGCGLGVTRRGIFLCGAGAGMARILGLDIGIQHLAECTSENMQKQAEQLCKYCGLWNGGERQHTWVEKCDKQMSPFWQRAVEEYHKNPKPLTVYGEK